MFVVEDKMRTVIVFENEAWWQSRAASSGMGDYVVVPTDILKGRTETLKPDPHLRKSPSLESLSRPPSLGFGDTRLLSASTRAWKPQSKLRYRVSNNKKSEKHWANHLLCFLLFCPHGQFTSTNISCMKMTKILCLLLASLKGGQWIVVVCKMELRAVKNTTA